MLLEILGGAAILAGMFVEIVSVPLIVSMLVAMFTVHIRYGFRLDSYYRIDSIGAGLRTSWV